MGYASKPYCSSNAWATGDRRFYTVQQSQHNILTTVQRSIRSHMVLRRTRDIRPRRQLYVAYTRPSSHQTEHAYGKFHKARLIESSTTPDHTNGRHAMRNIIIVPKCAHHVQTCWNIQMCCTHTQTSYKELGGASASSCQAHSA
jgi:hypothetical protein